MTICWGSASHADSDPTFRVGSGAAFSLLGGCTNFAKPYIPTILMQTTISMTMALRRWAHIVMMILWLATLMQLIAAQNPQAHLQVRLVQVYADSLTSRSTRSISTSLQSLAGATQTPRPCDRKLFNTVPTMEFMTLTAGAIPSSSDEEHGFFSRQVCQ